MSVSPLFKFWGSPSHQTTEVIASYIKDNLCEESFLLDPFCGGASVPLMTGHRKLILGDLQPLVILLLEVAKQQPMALIKAIEATLVGFKAFGEYCKNSDFFYRIRDNPPNDPANLAAWFLLMIQAIDNRRWAVDSNGKLVAEYDKYDGFHRPDVFLPDKNKVVALTRFINTSEVLLHNQAYQTTISLANEGDMVFLNPPIPGLYNSYTKEEFTIFDLLSLLRLCRSVWVKKNVSFVFRMPFIAELAVILSDWCRIFLLPWELHKLKSKDASGMIAISHPVQGELFQCQEYQKERALENLCELIPSRRLDLPWWKNLEHLRQGGLEI